MVTASNSSLQEKLGRYLGDISNHEKKIADETAKLAAIKNKREDPEHLRGIASGDDKTHRLDGELGKEQARLEKQINASKKLLAMSREYAEKTRPEIEKAQSAEFVGNVLAQWVAVENLSQAINPIVSDLRTELSRLDAGCLAAEAAIQTFPPWAREWVGKFFIPTFSERYRRALAMELTQVARGAKEGPASDSFDSSEIFSHVHRALETIQATMNGGGPGRKFYRVANGRLSGISGGLNLLDGERISLISDHPETKKFVELGSLKEEGSEIEN